MSIPLAQITHVEIIKQGVATAGGSNSRVFQIVTCWRRTAVILPIIKADIDSAFDSAVGSKLRLALNARYTEQFDTVRIVNDAEDAPVPFSLTGVGAVAGDGMPMHNSAMILLRSGKRGRSYKGSKHIGPLSEADTTSGTEDVFNAAALTRWGNVATALAGGFVDASGNVWVLSVLSRLKSQLRVNPTTVVANDVATILVNKRIGRMRHREVKSVY